MMTESHLNILTASVSFLIYSLERIASAKCRGSFIYSLLMVSIAPMPTDSFQRPFHQAGIRDLL